MSAPKLTEAQARCLTWLRDADAPEPSRSIVSLRILRDLGLCRPLFRGGYQITDAGRAALAAHEKGGAK